MACEKCGLDGSDCKCVICTCAENYGIDCLAHPVTHCDSCKLELLQNAISSGEENWCKCFVQDSFINSGPNQSKSNGDATNISSNGNFQDGELPLETVSLNSSHPNGEFESTHAQSADPETSVSSMPDTSDGRTTGNDQDEQINYLPIISSEENELVTEESALIVEETLPVNPSHAQSLDTETSESSISDISGSRVTVKNLTEQMDYLEVISAEETIGLVAEETIGLVAEETIGLVAEETPLNPSNFESTHAQSLNTETSESSMSDTSDGRTTGNDQDEQIDYLPIISSEENELVTEESALVVEETLPVNPSHAQSLDTETSESSIFDISGSRVTVKNLTEQMDYLEVISTEETIGLVAEETIGLVAEETPLNPSNFESMHAQSPDTETSESSMSDTSDGRTTGNDQDEQIDYLPIISSEENELVTEESALIVEEKLPLNPSYAQSLDTETSESSISDISGSRVTVKNRTEQMDYLEVIPTEETRLVIEETIELVTEETPLNPLHAQSHTEISESSMPDISGCQTKGNDRAEQMGNLPTNQTSEETGLNAEETELLNSYNILNDDQISYNPVNSADRVNEYRRILAQNIMKESLGTSNSRSETNNAEKNTLKTQASNSSSGIFVSGSPQVLFHGGVAVTPNLSTPPFPSYRNDSTTNQPFMCVPTVSVRQKFISPSTVTSGPSVKPPFYTDSATRRLQGHFSESAQNKSPTKPAFSEGSKKLSIPITPASKYARSKGVSPRESGTIIRPVGRTLDWLNKMTAAPGDMNSPEDDSTCSAVSPSSSTPPVKLVKDATELQNETKSDKDTNTTDSQSAVIASDESSSTFACSETTAHQGLTCVEDTSSADSENKILEQTEVSKESLDSCAGAISNLSTSRREELNEETELKEPIQDSSKHSEDEKLADT